MKDLGKRVAVALIGIPLLLYVIYSGSIPFFIAIIIISTISLWEFYEIARNKGTQPLTILGLLVNIISLTLLYLHSINFNITQYYLITFLLFIICAFLFQLFRKENNSISNISITIGGLIYINLMFASLYMLREFHLFFGKVIEFNPMLLVYSFIISIWVCDSAAYFVGSKFGKNKLMPSISPKKSWEGAVAGFIGSVLSMLIFNLITNNFSIIHSLVIGVLVGTAGQIGDLSESQIKRDANVKDSSNILPGHGGFLDRFDSIMFVSPIILLYLLILSF
ncbi:MAG TPA: phosphatidate cytidylyltransferase [Candidatus Kapabacteria bacterium]|nr:phosphatidate cytidylyltransferase [Candidatus Kapabacteria bacterium]